MKICDILLEFAPGGGSNSGDYLRALASAWYNHDIDMLKDVIKQGGSAIGRIVDAQQAVEKLLARGVHCGDGKIRKYNIDYNPSFDGVVIFSDDYYEHGDLDGNDGRTGQPWGPYDHMEFKDEELDESLNEFAPAGGGGNIPRGPKTPRRGPWDDNEEDPYQLRRYNRSVDFFDQFDSDGVDKQNFDKATGEYEGYYFDRDAASGITQIAYFKFDDPTKIGDNDPGIGWYYEPIDEGVAEGYSLGKVLTLPELLDQIKHILSAKHPGIGWRMTMPAENTFLFSAKNDYNVWSMLVVETGGDDWVAVGHGMVDPDGKPIIFDRQQLPMTLASASEIADEAIQTYHDIDLSDYADDEDYNKGVAEGIETVHGKKYSVDPDKYYVWAWDGAAVLYGEYDDIQDAKINLPRIEQRAIKRLGPFAKDKFEIASGKDLLRRYEKSEGSLNEFAPDSNDGGEDDVLHRYARMWWAGDEATQMQIERALAKMGWEIGEDEGSYDNGGVFVVRAGDVNGNSYISWPAEELDEGAPVTTTPGSAEPGGAVDNFKQQMANRTEIDHLKKLAGIKESRDTCAVCGQTPCNCTHLSEEFDLIESIVEKIAVHNGVDADVIWEDLQSLSDDELYVFAVTSEPIMEDWQKVNKQDRTSGMSRKAVKAYRREHPGSKLKTAVTTKPSKLKRGSKASKRRKSYCSRSRGQMKMHNISCAKTPDKAICKARRRWNC